MKLADLRLSRWLLRAIRCHQHQLQSAFARYEIEPVERRVLLATYAIPGSAGGAIEEGDQCTMRWHSGLLEWRINTLPFNGIPPEDDSGSPYNDIEVEGTRGNETLTLDFSNGAFGQSPDNPDPSVTFTGSGSVLADTLIIIKGGPADSIVQNPTSIVYTDSSDRSTTVYFGSGVTQIDFTDVPEPSVIGVIIGSMALLPRRKERRREIDVRSNQSMS